MFKFDYLKMGRDLDLKLEGYWLLTIREGLSRCALAYPPLKGALRKFSVKYTYGAGRRNFYVGVAKQGVLFD